ncbi:Gfo/Idh/MocA family oxidoreductase [Phototrophicus methaneseepsis]|uniref:Gfo/Idh/MocA family oxidoreductase n=1 Tax=Phototrophicus methaneseepsis TaxID=2710758 RepID=A0A7S8EC59_9CHLR|nr:Gfo/Idh/MocA family oxidoreductase [Phototrophicus methaneseepsis]QPC84280.1 Gfo/Idh/MocA family oxidoreductase [Phototrophicus methaneseepsis]
MSKIRWGIISTANIGIKRVIPAIQQSSNGEVAAIASRDLGRAQAVADELGIPKAYGSYEELIAADDIDAIYNPLPNSKHAKWSIACAEAGKPTLCEKPLASTAAEAQTMVNAFAERNIKFAEAFMYRFHPRTQKVKELIDDGVVGDVHMIASAFSFNIASEDNIRLSAELAGGALMDVGCYCINIMRHITGEEPDTCKAIARFGSETGVDERIVGVLGFPSGITGHLDASLRTYGRNWYEISGTAGRLLVETSFVPAADQPTVIQLWRDGKQDIVTLPAANQYTVMAEDFADAILSDRAPRYPGQDGVANMLVIDALLKSARESL